MKNMVCVVQHASMQWGWIVLAMETNLQNLYRLVAVKRLGVLVPRDKLSQERSQKTENLPKEQGWVLWLIQETCFADKDVFGFHMLNFSVFLCHI